MQEEENGIQGEEKPEEQNPVLVKALVEAGAQVQYVTEVKHSLEEVYFSLLQDEQPREVQS